MSINWSSNTPAAPTGATLVTFQTDGSGNVSAYVPSSAIELTDLDVDTVGVTGNVGPNVWLDPVPANGLYRVSGYLVVDQAATSSSILPSIDITWVDQDNSNSQSLTLTPTNTGNSLTTYEEADGVISCGASSTITYATSGYGSTGATPMTYSFHLRLESL
jgi:hypothetical protein